MSYSKRASADASVRSDDRYDNFGTSDNIYVGENSRGDIREMFIHFDLSSLPNRFRVNSAILSIFQYNSGDDWQSATTPVACEMCGAPWTETGITWNNKPANASVPPQTVQTILGTSDGVNGTNEYRFNVASHIAAVGNGTIAWNGFRLRYTGTSSSTRKDFRSREYGTVSQRPLLTIDWDYCFGKVKVDGAWKTVERIQTRVDGAWRDVTSVKLNVGGIWKQGI